VAPPAAASAVTWGYAQRPSAATAAVPSAIAPRLAKSGAQAQAVGPVEVLAKRTAFKPNEVLVQARFALAVEPRPAGWRELVERGFLAGGLGRHPADELSEVLAATPVRISPPRFDDDTVVIGASCLPKDLEVCLQELAAFIQDPGWRPEGEAAAKSAWLDQLRAEATSLDAQLARRFQTLAVHDAPHRRPATLEEAEALTYAAVRPWFTGVLAAAPLALTIVGDIDEAAALALVRPYAAALGAGRTGRVLPAPAADQVDLAECQPLPAGVHRFTVPGTVKRALIRVAWPASDYYDIARTRRLGVLAQVIDEQMRVRIREELGDAYSPFAYRFASEAYAGFGYVLAQVGVAPEKADEALAALLAIANDLANKGVSDDVFARVKAPIIKSLATQRQQNQYWLGSVFGRAAWQPFRVEWADSLEPDYGAITSADIAALARKYLINDHALQVIAVCDGTTPAK
jgi:zinc protease